MSISAISGGVPAGGNASLTPKRVCASLQEICLNAIHHQKDLAEVLKRNWRFRKLEKSAIRMILLSFEPYKHLSCRRELFPLRMEWARMDLPLSHPNEARVSVSARHRFQRFKEFVVDAFSHEDNQIPVDQIELLEEPKLFLQAVIALAETYPALMTWPDGAKPTMSVLLDLAETANCWESIHALLQAGAQPMPLDEDSEDEEDLVLQQMGDFPL